MESTNDFYSNNSPFRMQASGVSGAWSNAGPNYLSKAKKEDYMSDREY